MSNRRSAQSMLRIMVLLALLVACGSGDSQEQEIESDSLWDTFFGAMSDELAGEPSAEELAELEHFDQAGITFDYPALLRLRRDSDGDAQWAMTRGDFEMEVYAQAVDMTAADYLAFFAETMGGMKRQVPGP